MTEHTRLTLSLALDLAQTALKKGEELKLNPLTVAVLDAGGHTKVLLRSDKSSTLRPKIATGKALSALALGMPSRNLGGIAQERPDFYRSLTNLHDGLVPVAGGLLITASDGEVIGAMGITGDTSDNDEACIKYALEAHGFPAGV
jgi:uncharacterized protein GlcG (DUF336 family)